MSTFFFISEFDATRINDRSGVPYFILQASKNAGCPMEPLQVSDQRNLLQKFKSRWYQWKYDIFYKKSRGWYDATQSPAYSKGYAKSLNARHWKPTDFIFSINPGIVAFLPNGPELILWIDNSFDTYAMYPGRENICSQTRREAREVEQLAFARAHKIFVTSHWLAQQLKQWYNIPPQKIAVLPRGASIINWPLQPQVDAWIAARCRATTLQLLMVNSGNWNVGRKGGPLVVATWQLLKSQIPVQLTIVGKLPDEVKTALQAEGVICLGVLDKQDSVAAALYNDVLANAHFMFVPSKADGFGIVFAEAAAHGLPSVAKAVMGVTEAVKQGETGHLLPENAGAAAFAALIAESWKDKRAYADLCRKSFDYASLHFNWEKNVKRIIDEGNRVANAS